MERHFKCYQCGKYYPLDTTEYYFLSKPAVDYDWRLCSPTCLIGLAWEQQNREPKLSKSKSTP